MDCVYKEARILLVQKQRDECRRHVEFTIKQSSLEEPRGYISKRWWHGKQY
jgi:hypothetical protein